MLPRKKDGKEPVVRWFVFFVLCSATDPIIRSTIVMARQSDKTKKKMEKVMHEYKEGDLKSSSGRKVTSRKQAVAIGLNEAREAGGKVPPKKDSKKK